MEDRICHRILSRRCVGPQLFHEEHLVGEGRHYTCGRKQGAELRAKGSRRAVRAPKGRKVTVTIFCWSCFLYPVRQVSHKVKEEIALGHTDDLGAQHVFTKAEEAARGHKQGWLLPGLLRLLLTALSQLDFCATNC